jgi:hypothetical protein
LADDYDKRAELNGFIAEMYDYRSQASHSGAAVEDYQKIQRLQSTAIEFLTTMLSRVSEFASKGELKAHIRRKRLE